MISAVRVMGYFFYASGLASGVALLSGQHPPKRGRHYNLRIREQAEKLGCQRINMAAKPGKRKAVCVKQI